MRNDAYSFCKMAFIKVYACGFMHMYVEINAPYGMAAKMCILCMIWRSRSQIQYDLGPNLQFLAVFVHVVYWPYIMQDFRSRYPVSTVHRLISHIFDSFLTFFLVVHIMQKTGFSLRIKAKT